MDAEVFFSRDEVPRLQLELNKEGIESLRKEPRTYVSGVLRDGRDAYSGVAIRLRGRVGSFRPVDANPGFTLNFDKNVRGQRFHGMDKIHLVNSVEDPTRCREIIASSFFRKAGVPTARVSVARVALNGRDLGLYVTKEAVDHQFFELYFEDASGAIYEPGTIDDVDALKPKQKRKNKVAGDLKALEEAAGEKDPALRLKRLADVVDLDRFISFIATEALIADWDSYCLNSNNYRLYFDPKTRRFVFMPGEAQEILKDESVDFYPEAGGMVAEALIETEEGLRRYDERMEELFRTQWDRDRLVRTVRELQARMRTALLPGEIKEHDEAIEELIERIDGQTKRLQTHFAQVKTRMRFDPSGTAAVGGWKQYVESGRPVLDAGSEQNRSFLHIAMRGGDGVAGWKTKVVLREGKYRFEILCRTAGVTGDDGASVRAGDESSEEPLTGNKPWTRLVAEYEVIEPMEEVELACELEAGAGQAWFDSGSAKLSRIPSSD